MGCCYCGSFLVAVYKIQSVKWLLMKPHLFAWPDELSIIDLILVIAQGHIKLGWGCSNAALGGAAVPTISAGHCAPNTPQHLPTPGPQHPHVLLLVTLSSGADFGLLLCTTSSWQQVMSS